MEQSNRIQRSDVWEQIYKVVNTLPRAECNGMDAPDASSITTELEELFLKLLPIPVVSNCAKCGCNEDGYGLRGELCKRCEHIMKLDAM